MRIPRLLAAGLPLAALLAACGPGRVAHLPHTAPPAAQTFAPALAGRGGPLAFASAAPAAPVWDDYPYRAAPMTAVDPWDFPFRQCTSFAAFRVNAHGTRSGKPFARTYLGRPFGDARWWDDAALEAGLAVHDAPAVGRVAQWEAHQGGAGEWGHVAYVAAVYGPGDILVEEYNWVRGAYSQRRLTDGGGFWPSHFIEF